MKVWLTLLLLLPPLVGQLNDRLRSKMMEMVKNHPEATFGFHVYNIDDKAIIYDFNDRANLTPASTLKALTTASALEILGPEFRFTTRAMISGTIKDGILNGNFHVFPSGDPTTGSSYFTKNETSGLFSDWILALKELGVKKISGKVILECHGFETQRVPPKWSYEDLGNYFGAALGPLNCYDNRVYLTFRSGKVGSIATLVEAKPSVPKLQYKNEVVAAAIKYDNAYVFGAPRQYNQTLRGEIPANRSSFTIKAAVPEPEIFFAQQLVTELRNNEIEVPYGALSVNESRVSKEPKKELPVLYSPMLADIVRVTNIESNNLFAEALLKAIALKNAGAWSLELGREEVVSFWKLKGIDLSLSNLYDGSGLTRYNGISARTLTEIMTYMWSSESKKAFYASLPVAGQSGSLSNMLKGSSADGLLRAKSGYLDKIRAYTGYTKTATGQVAAFTLFVNNYNESSASVSIKKEMEALMKTISD